MLQEDYDAVVANLGMGSLPDEADETGVAPDRLPAALPTAKLLFTFVRRTGDTALLAAAETGNTAIAEVRALVHGNSSQPSRCFRALVESHS